MGIVEVIDKAASEARFFRAFVEMRGGVILMERREPDVFGNWLIEADLDGTLARLTCDRGATALQLKRVADERWHSARVLLGLAAHRRADETAAFSEPDLAEALAAWPSLSVNLRAPGLEKFERDVGLAVMAQLGVLGDERTSFA